MAHPISTAYLKKIACRLQSAVRYSSKVNKNIHTPCINSNTENPEKLYSEIINAIRFLEAPEFSHIEFNKHTNPNNNIKNRIN